MTCFEPGVTLDLAKRDNLPLYDVQGTLLRVTRGSLWVTQENDPRDLVLHAGDTWMVERDGLTIVEAQADSTVCIAGRRAAAVLTAWGAAGMRPANVRARLRRAVESIFAPGAPRTVPYF